MTTGELEYTATIIDQLNKPVANGSFIPLVPFEESTYIFYYLFILIMPIALVNLLVSITLAFVLSVDWYLIKLFSFRIQSVS